MGLCIMVLRVIISSIYFISSFTFAFAQRVSNADVTNYSSREPVAPAAIFLLYLIVGALVLWAIKDKEARPAVFYIVSPIAAGQIIEILFNSRFGLITMVGLYLFYIFGNWRYPKSK
jgi:hypothetical protein